MRENERLLRLPEVKERVGLARSAISVRVRAGTFPRPINLGGKAVAWAESDISEWIAEMIRRGRRA